MRVIGTAGHVDHGKSTLVQRAHRHRSRPTQRRKARGMTIDLGFAWIDLPCPTARRRSVGIVDVPGHIDFIKNMLAGVGGIDAAAGDRRRRGRHAADARAPRHPRFAGRARWCRRPHQNRPDRRPRLARPGGRWISPTAGGHAPGRAPIVPRQRCHRRRAGCSAPTLAVLLQVAAAPQSRPPALPIDRVFTLSGLWHGRHRHAAATAPFALGDAVEILPAALTARVRGLQSHKRAIEHRPSRAAASPST
jgi:selenocysteine-specific elongation factor